MPTTAAVIKRRCHVVKDKPVMRRLPISTITYPFHAYYDSEVQEKGLIKRVIRSLDVDIKMLPRVRKCSLNFVQRHLSPLDIGGSYMSRFDEWVLTTSYSMNRISQIKKSGSEWLESGASVSELIRIASQVKGFMKDEFYDEPKLPRGIHPRSDLIHFVFGPLVKAIEEKFWCLPYFTKHVPVRLRPMQLKDLHALGDIVHCTDYSGFEGSFSPDFMKNCECVLYRYMLGRSQPVLCAAYCAILTGLNRIHYPGLTVHVKGRRMSGDMCTSLGNTFSNLILSSLVCEDSGVELRGLFEGDDGLIFSQVPLKFGVVNSLGFDVKLVTSVDPGALSFCGIMADMEQLTCLGSIRRYILSFGWVSGQYVQNSKHDLEMLRARAMSLAWSFPGCPILKSMAKYLLRMTDGLEPWYVGENWWAKQMRVMNCPDGRLDPVVIAQLDMPIPPRTRMLYEQFYNIPPSVQLLCEGILDQCHDHYGLLRCESYLFNDIRVSGEL